MARLTPSSLKLSTASSATMAMAKVPNSSGPSRRAIATPMANVLSLPNTVLATLQPSARPALASSGSPSFTRSFTDDRPSDSLGVPGIAARAPAPGR